MTRMMRNAQRFLIITALIACMLSGCTVKKLEEVDKGKSSDQYSTWTKSGKEFDPVAYVDSIWDDKLVPEFIAESKEITTVLAALAEDQATATQLFGLALDSGEIRTVFKVKGLAKVLTYDASSRNGFLVLDLCPYDGQADITLQVGPVIKNTAIRDSVSFISFTDVGNQLHFANLADELNARMRKYVVDPLDLTQIEGKVISFTGAIKFDEGQSVESVVVTPIIIDIEEENGGGNE